MSGIGGKGLVGPSIFAGLGQAAEKGVDFYLKYKHLKAMEDFAKYRGLHGGVKDFLDAGGMYHPVDETEDRNPAATMGEEEAKQAASLRSTYSNQQVSAADLAPDMAQAQAAASVE